MRDPLYFLFLDLSLLVLYLAVYQGFVKSVDWRCFADIFETFCTALGRTSSTFALILSCYFFCVFE